MVIDKKLNLDSELEYMKDGSLVYASNVVLSEDGLSFQNEPALKAMFETIKDREIIGHIACNTEFVVFYRVYKDGVKTTDGEIYRITPPTRLSNGAYQSFGTAKKVETNWKWAGGDVFGTFTYNVNNELIIAISERNLPTGVDCPLKIINLDRDKYDEAVGESVYTLTPDIPKSNMIDISYVPGNKIRKGKYNFFIKYFINEEFETAWYPIGVPVFAYDNSEADTLRTTEYEEIQAIQTDTNTGDPDGTKDWARYYHHYEDFYNKDNDYTNDNIKLTFDINDELFYTHFAIGYIVTYNGGMEGRTTNKYLINTRELIINDVSDPVTVDDLTTNVFNIYNVNTMCNYKDRLYLANYKEENYNAEVENIDVSGITVCYKKDSIAVPEVGKTGPVHDNGTVLKNIVHNKYLYDYSQLKDQWKSKPGRAAVYNFYIHYVYPNGNYTDGIKIGSIDNYKYLLKVGKRTTTTEVDGIPTTSTINYFMTVVSTTTTNDVIAFIDEHDNNLLYTTYEFDETLIAFCESKPDQYWYVVANEWEYITQDDTSSYPVDEVPLQYYFNSNGDLLFRTPINQPFNVDKLIFTGIKMYPQFIGYFISYEKPEYINIGEGLIAPNKSKRVDSPDGTSYKYTHADLFDITGQYYETDWRFYYPEFGIIGGKTDVARLIPAGYHMDVPEENAFTVNYNRLNTTTATGYVLHKNSFDCTNPAQNITKSEIIAPNTIDNMGKEGYLRLTSENEFARSEGFNDIISYIALSKNYNIYLSRSKKLISLGYIKYQDYENTHTTYRYGDETVPYNYDFYRCFSSIYFFRYGGIIINEAESNPVATNNMYIDPSMGNATANWVDKGDYYYDSTRNENLRYYPHIGIVKYWHETHYPLFLKEINQEPQIIFRSNYGITTNATENAEIVGDKMYQIPNTVISPAYVNDLYKLDACYYDYTGKLLVNYDKTLLSNQMNEYTKTVRRSDVLQSESLENAWRYFRPENYKVITEDKGIITNVVGIGHYLFVHCEHSLFVFDINDKLKALDKDVQLLQPDTFDVDYKEVFTADKGYGGLQDYISWICDEFGYIFYDYSARSIYRFDNGQLLNITKGIETLIKSINPPYIYIGNDRPRNRILFGIVGNATLSYSLQYNDWLSTHCYSISRNFINLKDKVIIPNTTLKFMVSSFSPITYEAFSNFYHWYLGGYNEYKGVNDGELRGVMSTINDEDSFIDVCFTGDHYNRIKVLDFITYILNKEPNDKFEKLELEIYTNCCYSGKIDISSERTKVSEYTKPYYDYERWNFNWFRNKIDKIENGDVFNRLSGTQIRNTEKVQRGYDNALITGKYVVIRFRFTNTRKEVNVKDIQAYFK